MGDPSPGIHKVTGDCEDSFPDIAKRGMDIGLDIHVEEGYPNVRELLSVRTHTRIVSHGRSHYHADEMC